MNSLERAIVIATQAHKGQKDKAGAPYILHPLRVMLRLTTEQERIAGVLHDVVEDCKEWSFDALREEGFSEDIIQAIDSVTKRADETYDDFILRASQNPIGRKVKLADLHDNCDLSRIPQPKENDWERIRKYERAIAFLDHN